MGDETKPNRPSLRPEGGAGATTELVSVGYVLSERYELRRELARSPGGVVFEAHDREMGTTVAVKVLPTEMATNAKARKRMQREALAAMQLHHPHVVVLHGYHEDAATPYLVMEYLAGPSLAATIADGRTLDLATVTRLAEQIGSALDAAHRADVVHRDIKPENLLYDGDGGAVKLADFGVAYVIRDTMTRLTNVESTGSLLYVAPELLQGKKPSPQSDQYAWAMTLYRLLAGRAPFDEASVGNPLHPKAAEVMPIVGQPEHVDGALRRGLAADPAARFPDCAGLAAALAGEVVATAPVEPPPAAVVTPDESVGFGVRPSMVIPVALVLGMGVLWVFWTPVHRRRRRAA